MTEHPPEGQQEEQRKEDKMPSADEEQHGSEEQAVGSEAHQKVLPDAGGYCTGLDWF
jgi:hypothetical protein